MISFEVRASPFYLQDWIVSNRYKVDGSSLFLCPTLPISTHGNVHFSCHIWPRTPYHPSSSRATNTPDRQMKESLSPLSFMTERRSEGSSEWTHLRAFRRVIRVVPPLLQLLWQLRRLVNPNNSLYAHLLPLGATSSSYHVKPLYCPMLHSLHKLLYCVWFLVFFTITPIYCLSKTCIISPSFFYFLFFFFYLHLSIQSRFPPKDFRNVCSLILHFILFFSFY